MIQSCSSTFTDILHWLAQVRRTLHTQGISASGLIVGLTFIGAANQFFWLGIACSLFAAIPGAPNETFILALNLYAAASMLLFSGCAMTFVTLAMSVPRKFE